MSKNQPLPAISQDERVLWETVRDSNDAGEYEIYLADYPEGRYAAIARRRIERIEAGESVVQPTALQEAPREPQKNPASFDSERVYVEMPDAPAFAFSDGDELPQYIVGEGGFFAPNQTLYEEGRKLTFVGAPPVNFQPVNEAARKAVAATETWLDECWARTCTALKRPIVARPRTSGEIIAAARSVQLLDKRDEYFAGARMVRGAHDHRFPDLANQFNESLKVPASGASISAPGRNIQVGRGIADAPPVLG